MLRFIIISVVLLMALFDFLIICGPSIRKMLNERKKKKKKKNFFKNVEEIHKGLDDVK